MQQRSNNNSLRNRDDLLPDWIQEGFIRDDVARDHEWRHPGSSCLQTLVPASMGMQTQTEIRTTGNSSMLLVGTVIWIGALPHIMAGSGSLYWKLLGQHHTALKPKEMGTFIYQYLGSLHGQRAVGVSSFVDSSGNEATAVIRYVFDDNMLMPWTVEGFVVVDQDECAKDRPGAIQATLEQVIGGIVRNNSSSS